ncbi:hypothetical protein FLJC2902T_30640 [Flavobacterium limnosediminis JC2902]|uniref:Uncharacterized protein n=1 Tax=Flavobacterium limnosediminis JC2902 TaxID=1341181 RepID=V6SGT8_9FLAO|nr:hypothetical protein FLJC2902T_30640 [Flavobacterium limnosediminis JC2902]
MGLATFFESSCSNNEGFLFYFGFIFRKNKGKINAILWD